MVDECVSCETDDELLFTCSYCAERFCTTHQFPHHACAGFGRTGETGDRSDTAERPFDSSLDGGATGEAARTVDPDDATDVGGVTGAGGAGGAGEAGEVDPSPDADPQPVTVMPPRPSPRAESLSAGVWGGSGSSPAAVGDGVVNVRPMDSRRVVGGTEASAAPRTVGDWVSRQTYLTLLVKVGVIALLVNSAFYGGMAVTLYGLLPFVP